MITIKKFAFNPFQVNTFVLSDETKECAIIDPGCADENERIELSEYIKNNELIPKHLISTHSHIDHIAGNAFVAEKYDLKLKAHFDGKGFVDYAGQTAQAYGFEIDKVIYPEVDLKEGDTIRIGKSELEVVDTPGHANGSICLINHEQKFVIVGDVLFYQSIGRTDLPTGNFDLLQKSIYEKLFSLQDDYTVYCGHGPDTTIGFEKFSNPFLTGI